MKMVNLFKHNLYQNTYPFESEYLLFSLERQNKKKLCLRQNFYCIIGICKEKRELQAHNMLWNAIQLILQTVSKRARGSTKITMMTPVIPCIFNNNNNYSKHKLLTNNNNSLSLQQGEQLHHNMQIHQLLEHATCTRCSHCTWMA